MSYGENSEECENGNGEREREREETRNGQSTWPVMM